MAIVRSTLELGELWVSEALVDDVAANPRLELAGPLEELPFDAHGRLLLVSQPHGRADVPSTARV
jgi:hypothetical protein